MSIELFELNEENINKMEKILLTYKKNIPLDILYHNICLVSQSKKTRFLFFDQISKGGSSLIFKGYDRKDKEPVIIKELKTNIVKKVFREINILHCLSEFSNIIKLISYFKKDGKYYLVFPYYEHENTRRIFLHFKESQMNKFMINFLECLNNIHNCRVIHRDIKPGNIIFSQDQFYIIDFGISDFYIPFRKLNPINGTKNFKAPEQLLLYEYLDYGIDIWATGVLFCEMLFDKYPFFSSTDDEDILIKEIIKLWGYDNFEKFRREMNLEYPENFNLEDEYKTMNGFNLNRYLEKDEKIDQNLEDLLIKMLELNPKKRITAKQCLYHEYFIKKNLLI